MRRLTVTILLAFFAVCEALAAPAYPYPIKYRQPDGSIVEIRLHGDEYYHYATIDGQVVKRGADGFYRPALKPYPAMNSSAFQLRSRAESGLRMAGNEPITMGHKKFLVILVEFDDLHFTVENPQAAFSDMLNKRGYSDNGGTGSVYDYYYENSRGRFDPVYDVIGPVRLSMGYAEYGGNDAQGNDDTNNARRGFLEACNLAFAQNLTDFSQYDNDGNGYIDNIFFYFAGHNEAEGGDDNTIWPHQSSLYGFSANGVKSGSYACSSEYRGSSGQTMAGIGTFCHEFGHVLGLPDFYDTDYEKNGTANTVYSFSLMCNGNYNNNGRTPPYLGALERWILEWKDDLPEWESSGHKSLRPVYEADEGYTTPAGPDGEFFLYEVRDGQGWDSYIKSSSKDSAPEGLVVYHVDMSQTNMIDFYKAIRLWQINKVNCYLSHPCYYIYRPSSYFSTYQDLMFPGSTGTKSFEGKGWTGLPSGFVLSDISYELGTASFNLTVPDYMTLTGKVTDTKGRGIAGVSITLVPEKSTGGAPRIVSLRQASSSSRFTATTDQDGQYSIVVPLSEGRDFTAIFEAPFYSLASQKITLNNRAPTVLDMVLYSYSEGRTATLQKYSSPGSAIGYSSGDGTWSSTNAVHYTAAELSEYVGYKITAINYMINASKAEKVDVFIDFGAERVFTRTVTPQFNAIHSVDISDAGIVIPEGKDIYFGYSVKDVNNRYYMAIDGTDYIPGGGFIRSGYNTAGGDNWQDVEFNFIISADLMKLQSPYSSLGVKVISNPKNGRTYAAGTVLPLAFDNPDAGDAADSVAWYFDGAIVTEGFVKLTVSGDHTIKAVLRYPDGSEEEIIQVIQVQ